MTDFYKHAGDDLDDMFSNQHTPEQHTSTTPDIVAEWLDRFPYTSPPILVLEDIYKDCAAQAAREGEGSDRIKQLFEMHATAEFKAQMEIDRHEEIVGHLRNIESGVADVKRSVDRSAVLANAMDTATAHPFLTGFIGTMLIHKIGNLLKR